MAIKGLAQAIKIWMQLTAVPFPGLPPRHLTCGGVHHRENGLFGCQGAGGPRRLIRERIRLQRASADRV